MIYDTIQPWVLMWVLAGGMYVLAKGATVAAGGLGGAPVGRRVGYVLLFPGMNAAGFCAVEGKVRETWGAGVRYGVNVVLGAIVCWGVARWVPPRYALVEGWIGMIGLILMLHFGVLQLVSLAWRVAGYDAPALMREPLRSASVGEFWGARWNTAFRELSHRFLFKPLARRVGAGWGMLLTFFVSGLVHDVVISVPAGGGFGLPTAYFLLQGAGVWFERSAAGRCWMRGVVGRWFAIAVVALPAPMLFHPLFVRRVMVPFLVALGAVPQGVPL